MSIMRTALLSLSRNRTLQDAMVRIPLARRMSRRFVAGETLQEAIAAVLDLNDRGLLATLDHLGESVTSEAEAVLAAADYLLALEALKASGADCNVSVKLTQMGLDLGDDFCYDNFRRVAGLAAELGNFVRVDMEGSALTDRTLAIYRRLRREFDNVGIAMQSYLRRSQADVEALIDEGIGNFRLCKGAYDEPASIAYLERQRVTQALNELVRTCLAPKSVERGAYCGVASHDEEVVNFARAYAYQQDLPPTAYEFQMLYGIRTELQDELLARGYKVRIYVPYGTHWYPFYMRRLAERPANLLFFLRAFVGD